MKYDSSAKSQYAPTYVELERAYSEAKDQRNILLECLQKLLPNLYYEERELAESAIARAKAMLLTSVKEDS